METPVAARVGKFMVNTRVVLLLAIFAGAASCSRRETAVRPDDAGKDTERSLACPAALAVKEVEAGTLVRTVSSEGVILKGAEYHEVPSVAEVVAFECGFAEAVAAFPSRSHDDRLPADVAQMKRQYYVELREGQRTLIAGMYCVDEDDVRWLRKRYNAGFDAGYCDVRTRWDAVAKMYIFRPHGFRSIGLPGFAP